MTWLFIIAAVVLIAVGIKFLISAAEVLGIVLLVLGALSLVAALGGFNR